MFLFLTGHLKKNHVRIIRLWRSGGPRLTKMELPMRLPNFAQYLNNKPVLLSSVQHDHLR